MQENVVASVRGSVGPSHPSPIVIPPAPRVHAGHKRPGDPEINLLRDLMSQASVEDIGFDAFTSGGASNFWWAQMPLKFSQQNVVVTGFPVSVDIAATKTKGKTKGISDLRTAGKAAMMQALESRTGRQGYGGLRLWRVEYIPGVCPFPLICGAT